MAKTDVIIHPTRLRIIQTFGGGRRLTAQQLAELLPDIPRASLYRHLNLLVEADILAVVEEHPVRAIQERVYALVAHAANVGPAEYTARTAEEHLRYFTTFLELLRGDFIRYLQRDAPVDAPADGVAYYQMPLYLSAEEYQQLIATLQAVLWPLVAQPPTPRRQRRLLSIIAMPAVEPVPDPPPAERADEDVTADVLGWDAAPPREKG
ncbi:MAG TPA: helix-turn-helix domain-containing protein [Ktedonobacterales bacterium]|nr:helix-turn-helix domain-containing protein [Ktedonobacterales bacterium]